MNENLIPKWQRELRSFIGIKSGIILEGNVYDEFPRFSYDGEDVEFLETLTDDLNEYERSQPCEGGADGRIFLRSR